MALIENAMAIEIARGRPSGMATIKIQMARIPILDTSMRVAFENNFLSGLKVTCMML